MPGMRVGVPVLRHRPTVACSRTGASDAVSGQSVASDPDELP